MTEMYCRRQTIETAEKRWRARIDSYLTRLESLAPQVLEAIEKGGAHEVRKLLETVAADGCEQVEIGRREFVEECVAASKPLREFIGN